MKIAILGASGYLGTRLIRHLITKTDFSVVAIARETGKLEEEFNNLSRIEIREGDIFDEAQISELLQGVDVAYYFIHLMGQHFKDFYTEEATAAHRFSAAAIAARVKRVVYMGGLGNDHERLSKHLASRHNTGTILRENLPLVIEFRASMIIGRGSLAFEVIRNLVAKLPLMTLPRWANTLTQPITEIDALEYLTQSATVVVSHHEIIEIGGAEVMSYKELYRKYAKLRGRKAFIIRLPFLSERVGGWWLNLFMPEHHAAIGGAMADSMANSMIVTHVRALEIFPDITPQSIDAALKALAKKTR